MNPLLTVELTIGDGYAVLALAGELDLGSVHEPRELLFQAIGDHEPRLVVIDCADLRFLDSSGLGAFVAARRRLAEVGGRLALANLGASTGKPVRLTGLDKAMHVHWCADEPVRPWAVVGASVGDVSRGIGMDAIDVPVARPAPLSDSSASVGGS